MGPYIDGGVVLWRPGLMGVAGVERVECRCASHRYGQRRTGLACYQPESGAGRRVGVVGGGGGWWGVFLFHRYTL